MLRHEVQQQTGLTRKAIEYYEARGLIKPQRDENEYRRYTDDDVARLERIGLFRRLGLSLEDIERLLDQPVNAIGSVIRRRELHHSLDQAKLSLLKDIQAGADIRQLRPELDQLERQETIYRRLERIFPGYFGQLLFRNYQPYLNEPLDEAHQAAFDDFIEFLDGLPEIDLTPAEKDYLETVTDQISLAQMDQVSAAKDKAVADAESWWADNQAMVEKYRAFKQSEEYQALPIATIEAKLRQFMQTTGYYTTAIPLLRQFSPAYDAYYRKLLAADEQFRHMIDR